MLRDVSFALEEHSFHFLTGPSGAGENHFAEVILQSMRPSAGSIALFGQDVRGISKDQLAILRRRIGIVLQDFRLLDHLSVYDNVALPLRVQGKDEASYRARCANCSTGSALANA